MAAPKIALDVRADIAAVRSALQRLPERIRTRAIVAALNETMTKSKGYAQAAIQGARPVTAAGARGQLLQDRANADFLQARISIKDGPIPLKYYDPKQTEGGVSVQVTATRKGPVSVHGNKAFIVKAPASATSLSGKTTRRNRKLAKHPELVGEVMVRTGTHRLHIERRFGPSVGSALNKTEVLDLLKTTAAPLFMQKLKQKIAYEAGELGLRVYL